MVVVQTAELERLMANHGLRDVDLASRMGVSLSTVHNVRAGQGVSGGTISALLTVFDVPFEDLFSVQTIEPEPASVSPAGSGS